MRQNSTINDIEAGMGPFFDAPQMNDPSCKTWIEVDRKQLKTTKGIARICNLLLAITLLFPVVFLLFTPVSSFAGGFADQKNGIRTLDNQSVVDSSNFPAAKLSKSNNVWVLNDSLIRRLPFRNLTKAISLLPGTDERRGSLYLTGGLPYENSFMLDGANITNVFAGGPGLVLPQDAVQQIEVQNFGFPAQYGGANGGLVRTRLKTGGQHIHATLQLETDNYTPQGKESLGGYSYGYSDYAATLSGPVISDKVRFFGAAEDEFYRDPGALYGKNPAPMFWNGITFNGLVAAPQFTLAHPNTAVADTLDLNYPAGNKFGGQYDRNSYAGTLLFDLGKIQFEASGSYSYIFSQDPAGISEMFDTQRLPVNRYRNGFGNFKVSQPITPEVSYEMNVNYYSNSSEAGLDPSLGKNMEAYGSPSSNPTLENGSFNLMEAPWTIFGPTYGGDLTIYQPGTLLATNPQINSETAWGGRLDFTIAAYMNLIKFGGEYERYKVRQYAPGLVSSMYSVISDPLLSPEAKAVRLRGMGSDNFGYDEFGNLINSNQMIGDNITEFGPRHPVTGALYVQDELSISNFKADIGLRYDYLNPDSWGFKNPRDVSFVDSLATVSTASLTKAPTVNRVDPRIGVTFTPTDRTIFYADYDRSIQEPEYDYSYTGTGSMYEVLAGGFLRQGSQGFGLAPETSTQYDVGVLHRFGVHISLNITAFYKDILNTPQIDLITPEGFSQTRSYYSIVNGSRYIDRGIMLSAMLKPVNQFEAQVNYTLSESYFSEADRATVILDYRFANGNAILEHSRIDVIALYGSGYPPAMAGFSYIIPQLNYPPGPFPVYHSYTSWTFPSTFELDARIDKTVRFGVLDAVLYIYIQNLLNAHNPDNVFVLTGDPANDGWLGTTAGQAYAAQQFNPALYREVYTAAFLGNNSGNYESPRQIRFGVRFEY